MNGIKQRRVRQIDEYSRQEETPNTKHYVYRCDGGDMIGHILLADRLPRAFLSIARPNLKTFPNVLSLPISDCVKIAAESHVIGLFESMPDSFMGDITTLEM